VVASAVLEFGCRNTAYRPVMVALALLARYAGVEGKTRFFADADTVSIEGVVPRVWRDAVVDDRGRVERIPYELCVLVALREALRHREIYVWGAHRWRDLDEDLPGDFDTTREVHYAALRRPTDPSAFITGLRERVSTALAGPDTAVVNGTAGGVTITIRRGEPWISVPKLTALPEPGNLAAVKDEVIRRWGTPGPTRCAQGRRVPHRTEFSSEFTSVTSREVTERDTLRRRLLLCLFALGRNMGIKAIVATGEHGETETALRHGRRRAARAESAVLDSHQPLRPVPARHEHPPRPHRPVRGSMCGSDCAASGGIRRRCGEDVETGLAAPSQGQMRPPWPHHTKETQHDEVPASQALPRRP
jgi:hypothetical protein